MKSFSAYAGGFALGGDHAADRRPHHRGDGPPGAQLAARGVAGARRPGLAHDRLRSCCARRAAASSPASCSPSRASPARPRRCSSPPSATSSGTTGLRGPISSLPVQIYTYAISPFDDWHRQAWAGALVLLTLISVTSLSVRLLTRGRIAGRHDDGPTTNKLEVAGLKPGSARTQALNDISSGAARAAPSPRSSGRRAAASRRSSAA